MVLAKWENESKAIATVRGLAVMLPREKAVICKR